MILDDIASQRLPRRAPVRWGDLRVGDTIRCPHDRLNELVITSEAHELVGDWRVIVGADDDLCGRVEQHFHVRPATDVAPAVQPTGGGR